MSTNGGDDENRPGREVAYRLFATEFDDSVVSYAESDEERAPNYVISPTGARLNRIFVVGTLTEVTDVNDEMVRARVVDPTGAFVVYAGQYQPDALAFLERAEPPAFVAVSGKARTFEPDDGDQVYTSIRPESLAIVDAPTRDRWVVDTAEHTIDRIETYAAAADLAIDDSALSDVLRANGLPDGSAEGIPLATHHYETAPAYLDALREVAIDAVRVVAEDKSQVEATAGSPTATASDAPSYATLADGRSLSIPDELSADEASDDTAVDDVATATDASTASAVGTATASPTDSTDDTTAADGVTDDASNSSESADATEPTESEPEADDSRDESANTRPEDEKEATARSGDELGDFETESSTDADETVDESVDEASVADSTDDEDEESADDATAEQPGDGDDQSPTDEDVEQTDEPVAEPGDTDVDELDPDDFEDGMYELDEDERAAVEEEYGTDFTTGTDVGEPGEADIDVPDAADVASEGDGSAEDADASTTTSGTDSATADPADEDSTGGDLDLQTRVVEAMDELDDGEGAERSAVVELVAEEADADEAAIDDAIQDALMGGECFEPAEDRLQAI